MVVVVHPCYIIAMVVVIHPCYVIGMVGVALHNYRAMVVALHG